MKKIHHTLLLCFCSFFALGQETTDIFEGREPSVTRFPHNTSMNEFAPGLAEDVLYYPVFFDKHEEEEAKIERPKGFYRFCHLRKVALDKNGDPLTVPVYDTEKSIPYHDGAVCFNKKTGMFFLTRSGYEGARVEHKVFRRRFVELRIDMYDAQSKEATPYAYNNKEYSIAYPAVTENGDIMYFTSDMPGGYGGKDLYRSVRRDGLWGAPENLGATINTEHDELYPSLWGDSLFIFSSVRPGGLGGMDFYASRITDGGRFTKPLLVSGELNSPEDDFGLSMSKIGNYGYFSSNRGETGDDDIYKISWKGLYMLHLTVLDVETREHIPLFTVNAPNDTLREGKDGTCIFPLQAETAYEFVVASEGYLNQRFEVDTKDLPYGTHKDTVLLYRKEIDKIFRLENIYYAFDKWYLTERSKGELDKLVSIMEENPDLRIQLRSHTDSRGSDFYNLKLSQKRAQSCKLYLVEAGIALDRIETKGFGESQLINECDDSRTCPEERHWANRRTELKIIK